MEEPEIPQRDLTIYLLKEETKEPADALREAGRLKSFKITAGGATVGELYVKPPRSRAPRWAEFFNGHLDIAELGRVASTSAVLIAKTQGRLFALTFGQGRFLMAPDCWEERFGLRVAVNCIDPAKLRSLDKRTFDALSTHSRIQGSREGSAPDFGLDVEQDLVRAVTGTPNDDLYGSRLSGMDSLHCAIRTTVADLKPLLRRYAEKSEDDSYKKSFPWIDHIAEVTDKKLIGGLDEVLIQAINGERERCWLCIPEIIDWGRTAGFRYALSRKSAEFQDLNFDGFLESVDGDVPDAAFLRRRHAYRIDNEGNVSDEWQIYRCVYCELELENRTYVLSGGRWFRIDKEFVETVNALFSAMPRYERELPEYDDASEGAYCARIADTFPNDFALMDQKTIQIGGAHGRVEFCDLFTATKDLIHVKRYGASSVLSHLFSQAIVSGEAFRADPDFRAGALARLAGPFQLFTREQTPQPAEFQIVFAVVTEKSEPLQLPFFSRVNLRQATRRLQAFGYRTSLLKIQVAEARAKLKRYIDR
ncbi:MAG: DUF6119 family protein [Terriglobales bacterium]